MIDNIIIVSLLVIQIIILIILTIKIKRSNVSESDSFLLYQRILLEIIEDYNTLILLPKIEKLRKEYDLNPKSQTQAVQAYRDAENLLYSEAAKDILKNYLSSRCRKVLIMCYGLDSLILYIVSNLKR